MDGSFEGVMSTGIETLLSCASTMLVSINAGLLQEGIESQEVEGIGNVHQSPFLLYLFRRSPL